MSEPFSVSYAKRHVNPNTAVWWIRRDIRIKDNAALYHALKNERDILPLFIFDTNILDQLDDRADQRVEFILDSLHYLHQELQELGSTLLVICGDPIQVFKALNPKAVYTNHDYEPYARRRDEEVKKILSKKNVTLHTFKDQVIFEKDEVIKDDGSPYTVFTPFSRKWKTKLNPFFLKSYPTEKYFGNLFKSKPLPLPSLDDIGFTASGKNIPQRIIKTSIISNYNKTRDFPYLSGTSRLGVHLRFGTISIRQLARLALKKNETFLNELIWREFYQMILWHFPQVQTKSFKPAYDNIKWRNNEQEFDAWCNGRTGYPIVDAGMRELNTTGFMHNRVRMVTASFLTKHLLIDWRWGEAYFAKKLLDYDLAANNGGWQWAAGSGCDAAPYFRIFNPELQTKRFDPKTTYIKKWVPELLTEDYPKPIVDHKLARERVLKVFQAALEKNNP